jgi:2-oxoglutarate ferredoxin oxidoreductase subunit alpha
VSATFQINFGSRRSEIDHCGRRARRAGGDEPGGAEDQCSGALKPGGLIIADTGEFNKRNLEKAKYEASPLEDGSLTKLGRAGLRHQRADASKR